MNWLLLQKRKNMRIHIICRDISSMIEKQLVDDNTSVGLVSEGNSKCKTVYFTYNYYTIGII